MERVQILGSSFRGIPGFLFRGRLSQDAANLLLVHLILVANFLRPHSYEIYQPSALLLILALVLPWVLLYLLLRLAKAEWLLGVALLIFFADMNSGVVGNLYLWGKGIGGASKVAGYAVLGSVALGLSALVYRIRETFRKILFVFFLAVLTSLSLMYLIVPSIPLFADVRQEVSGNSFQGHRPNLYIFYLDEHSGLAGLSEAGAYPRQLADDLGKMYAKNGFVVYANAFSNYFNTFPSVYALLNGQVTGDLSKCDIDIDAKLNITSIRQNKLFEMLRDEGYKINVYQSSYINYCHADKTQVQRCFTYRGSSLGYLNLPEFRFRLSEKYKVLLNNLVYSYKSVVLYKIYHGLFRPDPNYGNFETAPLVTDRVLREVKDDIKLNNENNVFFIHLLNPHYPYVFNADCTLKEPSAWEKRYHTYLGKPENTDESQRRKYIPYSDQVRCLHQKLTSLFEGMSEERLFEEATIILFSDHGSRITILDPTIENFDKLPRNAYLHEFSAFLAVKNGGYDPARPVNQGELVQKTAFVNYTVGNFLGFIPETHDMNNDLFKIYLSEKPDHYQAVDPQAVGLVLDGS